MSKTKTIDEINTKLEQLRVELENVHGTKTEVYTRIVGYYRDVKQWNKGKQEEFKKRVEFDIPPCSCGEALINL